MDIGSAPFKLVSGFFSLVSKIIKAIYHSIKMSRYYKKSREG